MKNRMYNLNLITVKRLLILIVIFQISKQSIGQNLYPALQEFVPESPSVATFSRYGNIPVNYNTGLANVSIPIYTVKSGSLQLPIGMSFTATGRMENENNGELGMRWKLSAGAVITRSVHGYPDEWMHLDDYTVNHQSSTLSFESLFYSCVEGYKEPGGVIDNFKYDSELDVFDYSLPSGKSGQFVLKKENGSINVLTIPYEPLQFEFIRDNVSSDEFYSQIIITDTDGTVYKFGTGDLTDTLYYDIDHSNIDPLPLKIPIGWYLERMETADGNDFIEFGYEDRSLFFLGDSKQIHTFADDPQQSPYPEYWDAECGCFIPYSTIVESQGKEKKYASYDYISTSVVKYIKFKNGRLDFNRDDIYNSHVIEDIQLTGRQVNKKFKFNYEKYEFDSEISYLRELEIISINSDASETVEQKYAFDYYEFSGNLYGNTPKKDWWGYFNKNINDDLYYYPNISYLHWNSSTIYYQDIGDPNLNRTPDSLSLIAGMIKEITYPTGGSTSFEYEHNYYKANNIKTKGPGLRIAKITNKPLYGQDEIKVFKYGENEDGVGYINPAFEPYKYARLQTRSIFYSDASGYQTYNTTDYRIRQFSSDPLINAKDFGGNITRYNKVYEYQIGVNEQHKVEYEYSSKYFDIEEYEIDNTSIQLQYRKVFANPYRLWQGGKLKKKRIYKYDSSLCNDPLLNCQELIQEEIFEYDFRVFDEVWDMPTYRKVHFLDGFIDYNKSGEFFFNEEKSFHNSIESVIGYGFRQYISGAENLYKKTVKKFDGDELNSVTDFDYDSVYNFISKQEIQDSDEKIYTTEFTYPFDETTTVYNKMLGLNMINIPITKTQYVNGVFTQGTRTEYFEWEPDLIRPKTSYYQKAFSVEEEVLEYKDYYSNGNLQEAFKIDGTHIVYIWGYNEEYPVAKIENATYTDVATALGANLENIQKGYFIQASGMPPTYYSDGQMRTMLSPLRTSLPKAMVTTYTYDPLIGVTSITDSKGLTTYYEYDDFGRLETVKDAESNLLSKNEYHYQQQP